MTRNQEIDNEIARLAHKLSPNCVALFELPLKIYAQIMEDNVTRKNPYHVSEARIRKIIHSINL